MKVTKMRFKVRWKKDNDEGIESEASWFLIDQQGHFYVHGPMEPIRMVEKGEYDELIPLIQIDDKWLTIEDIKAENAKLKEKVAQQETYIEMAEADLAELSEENAKLKEKVERLAKLKEIVCQGAPLMWSQAQYMNQAAEWEREIYECLQALKEG
jgi:hypothetical protein